MGEQKPYPESKCRAYGCYVGDDGKTCGRCGTPMASLRWCQGCGKPESELTNVGQGGHLVPPDVACGPLSTPEELIEALDDTRSQLADAIAAVAPDGECLLCDMGEGDHLCPEPYPQTPDEDAAATLMREAKRRPKP